MDKLTPNIYLGSCAKGAECYFCGAQAIGDIFSYHADRFILVCLEHMAELAVSH